jgi:hypothetical protein
MPIGLLATNIVSGGAFHMGSEDPRRTRNEDSYAVQSRGPA